MGTICHLLLLLKIGVGVKKENARSIRAAGCLDSAYPQMALSRDFGLGHHDLNPQHSPLCLRFKSAVRLELTRNPSSVDGQ
jgi:hypothetical protein